MFLVALVFTLALTVRGDLPDSFDLRTAYPKCIPPVKNSGQCGAAMIFAGVDGLSINFCTASHGNQLIPLSADFVEICEANGCNGEDPETIIDFLEVNGTLVDGCVPSNVCANATCSPKQSDQCCLRGASRLFRLKQVSDLSDYQDIQETIFNGAAVVTYVDASEEFQIYTNGIIECDPGERELDHVVYIIGWGAATKTSPAYWIGVNSWGTSWGMDGYFYIQMGVDACGIEEEAMYFIPDSFNTCSMTCNNNNACLGGTCGSCELNKCV